MKTNMLKMLAMKAKNRMMKREDNTSFLNARVKIIMAEDGEFLDKVREILANEKKSINPLKYLMDERQLIKMDNMSRERYLLQITEKYLKAKALIERQQCFSQGA